MASITSFLACVWRAMPDYQTPPLPAHRRSDSRDTDSLRSRLARCHRLNRQFVSLFSHLSQLPLSEGAREEGS